MQQIHWVDKFQIKPYLSYELYRVTVFSKTEWAFYQTFFISVKVYINWFESYVTTLITGEPKSLSQSGYLSPLCWNILSIGPVVDSPFRLQIQPGMCKEWWFGWRRMNEEEWKKNEKNKNNIEKIASYHVTECGMHQQQKQQNIQYDCGKKPYFRTFVEIWPFFLKIKEQQH